MSWYGLVDDATGSLKGIGTETMFPGGDINAVPDGMVRVDFGETRPDLAAQQWNSTNRQFESRPAPVLIDRADEFRQRLQDAFQANADFMSVYNTLTNQRKTALRTAMDTVLTAEFRRILGGRRFRQTDEPVDIE